MSRLSRRFRPDAEPAAQLAAFWDELTESGRASQPAPEPDLVGMIERLRQLDARDAHLNPAPAFAQRLASELFGQPALSPSSAPVPSPVIAPPPRRRPSRSAWPRLIRPSRWLPALELLVVAAILLLLVSSYPGRNAFIHGTGPAATPMAASGPSVPMLGGNPARTGEEPGPGPSGKPVVRWHVTYDPLLGPIAVVDDVAYASTFQGLVALDATTGALKWRTPILDGLYSAPAVVDGVVYVGSDTDPSALGSAGYLIAYDAKTGRELWRVHVGYPGISSPVVVGGTVFIAGSAQETATLYAVDARSGMERWHASLGHDQCQCSGFSPAVADGIVYAGSAHGTLYAFDAATGNARWKAETSGNDLLTPSVAGGAVFVSVDMGGYQDTSYAAFDARDGHVLWESSVAVPRSKTGSSAAAGVAVANGVVYQVGPDQTGIGIRAVDAATGKPIWMTRNLGAVPGTAPVVAGGVIYVGGTDGSVIALDAHSGTVLWQLRVGGRVAASPTVLDGAIYVGTREGTLSALTSPPSSVSASVGAATPGATPAAPSPPCPPPVGRTSSDRAVPGTPAAGLVGGRAPFSGNYLDRTALPPGGPVASRFSRLVAGRVNQTSR